MTFLTSAILLCAVVCGIFFLLQGQKKGQRAKPSSTLLLEYRTDLPLDTCIDLLRARQESDLFAYTYTREADGSFTLAFTLHRPTQQPVGTVYSLRLDSGRQTIITLAFLREAFGYQEPVFPLALLDEFFAAKLTASRMQ